MSWIHEFGDGYALPAEVERLVNKGLLADHSWHNDTHPHFETMDGALAIWVDHPDPTQRESYDEHNPHDSKRYGVYVGMEEMRDENLNLYYGDDLRAALRTMGFSPAEWTTKCGHRTSGSGPCDLDLGHAGWHISHGPTANASWPVEPAFRLVKLPDRVADAILLLLEAWDASKDK